MPPRRSVRRNSTAYKKGDYVEYQHKGSTVTGRLALKVKKGPGTEPSWIVTPSDRRRKNEEISISELGKIIDSNEARARSRGPKVKKATLDSTSSYPPTSSSPLSNTSEGSSDEFSKCQSGKVIPRSDENTDDDDDDESVAKSNNNYNGKRCKVEDALTDNADGRSKKTKKTVSFSQESDTTSVSRKKTTAKSVNANAVTSSSARIVTRSTRGSGEAVLLLPELPMKKKIPKGKKVSKDENVTVVKMFTGTLYLYRGDRPRAEFVRHK